MFNVWPALMTVVGATGVRTALEPRSTRLRNDTSGAHSRSNVTKIAWDVQFLASKREGKAFRRLLGAELTLTKLVSLSAVKLNSTISAAYEMTGTFQKRETDATRVAGLLQAGPMTAWTSYLRIRSIHAAVAEVSSHRLSCHTHLSCVPFNTSSRAFTASTARRIAGVTYGPRFSELSHGTRKPSRSSAGCAVVTSAKIAHARSARFQTRALLGFIGQVPLADLHRDPRVCQWASASVRCVRQLLARADVLEFALRREKRSLPQWRLQAVGGLNESYWACLSD
eukprot:scaffold6009_cov248-Pinguiococcus_pyrenoidosus.AAC.2